MKVKEAAVDQGQSLKRMKERALGRADIINKRRSHLKIILVEEE
ncbi:MAG: 50S ribosomal protein L22 [Candidatus Acetothermia bacterium]